MWLAMSAADDEAESSLVLSAITLNDASEASGSTSTQPPLLRDPDAVDHLHVVAVARFIVQRTHHECLCDPTGTAPIRLAMCHSGSWSTSSLAGCFFRRE